MKIPEQLTKWDLQEIAIQLDAQSGFPELTDAQSWHARAILGPAKYAMHEAASKLWHAAGALENS